MMLLFGFLVVLGIATGARSGALAAIKIEDIQIIKEESEAYQLDECSTHNVHSSFIRSDFLETTFL